MDILAFVKLWKEGKEPKTCYRTIDIDDGAFYRFLLIPAGLLIVAFVLLRQWILRDSSPRTFRTLAVIWPVDLICQRDHRLPYVAAFSISAWSVFNVIAGNSPLKFQTNITALKSLLNLATCILFATIFYPVFVAITSKHVIGYVLGTLYVWVITVVYIFTNYPCENDEQLDQVYMTLRFLPCVLWMLYLCAYFPYCIHRIINDKRKGIHPSSARTFEHEYVRRLLTKKYATPVPYLDHYGFLGSIKQKISGFVFRKIYAPIPGYRYPVSMLTAASVSSILVWATAFTLLKVYHNLSIERKSELLSFFDIRIQDKLENVGVNHTILKNITNKVTDTAAYLSYPAQIYKSILYSMYSSFGLALFANIISMLCSLRNYRDNILMVYSGRNQCLPSVKSKSPSCIVETGSRYVGYQFAYSLWGFLVQAVFLLALCIGAGYAVVTSSTFNGTEQALQILYTVGPPLLYVFVLIRIQRLLVHLFFLLRNEEGQRVLAINRLLPFLNFHYFMVFMNSAVGLVSCLFRIVKATLLGVFTLQRLDISALSRTFEGFDNGFDAYVCLLAVENVQTNPILVTFVDLLRETTFRKKCRDLFKSRLMNGVPAAIDPESQTKPKTTGNNKARNRWHLALTLHRNPYLRHYRTSGRKMTLVEAVRAFADATKMVRLELLLRDCQKVDPTVVLINDQSGFGEMLLDSVCAVLDYCSIHLVSNSRFSVS